MAKKIDRQKRQNINQRKASASFLGFTLIEIILYIAIIAVFLVSVSYFALEILSGKAKVQASQEVQQNVRFVLEVMTQKIRGSENGIDVEDSNFGSHPGRLHLEMGTGSSDDIIFYLDSSRLVMQEGTDGEATSNYLTSDEVSVDNLVFTNLSETGTPGNIKIDLTVSFVNPSGAKQFEASTNIETSISLRVL